MNRFKDRVIWITGASSGIGSALAIELARVGAVLALSGRDPRSLGNIVREVEHMGARAKAFPFDISASPNIPALVEEIIGHFGRIDLLINNAGISQRARVEESDSTIDRKIMEVNYFGNVALTRALLPYMKQQGFGHIAVTTSIVGLFGFPLRSAYAASKHALHGFYESLRTELTDTPLAITFIIPGRVKTNISYRALNKNMQEQGILDQGQARGLPASKAARVILKGLARQKKQILVGGRELYMVYIHKYFPWLFDHIVRKIKHV